MPKTLEKFDMLPLQYEDIVDLKNNYLIYSFSVFDHWLTESEFCEEITNYYQTLQLEDKPAIIKYFEREDQLLNFYINLYNMTSCYGVFLDSFSRCVYIKYDSENEFKSHIKLGIREEMGIVIVMPELASVIASGHDLTHQLYILHNCSEQTKTILGYIKQCGLHLLE